MKRKYSKRTVFFVSLLLLVFIIVLNNQSVRLSANDKAYIERFLNDWHISKTPEQVHKNFDEEISFISTVQDSVIAQIRHCGIPHEAFGDVNIYYVNRKGQCYDRAVLLEKIFAYYHFPFRHVYMYFGKNSHPPTKFEFFSRYLPSHALTEVKTAKGWLTVGSNTNWLGIDSTGQLLTIGAFRDQLLSNAIHLKKTITLGMPPFWTNYHDYRFIYGLYSRHGDFFGHGSETATLSTMGSSFHFLPDYNLKMFFYNFVR